MNRDLQYYLLPVLIFSLLCCGPSSEDRFQEYQLERETQRQLAKEQEVKIIKQLEMHFNAEYFPPSYINANTFTYEFQKFFKDKSQKNILFKGYVEDIEKFVTRTYIEVLCSLSDAYFIDKIGIRFRLKTTDQIASNLISEVKIMESTDDSFHILQYYKDPNYFFVAKINRIMKSHIFQNSGYGSGDDVEIYLDEFKGFVSYGELVDYTNNIDSILLEIE